MFAVTDVEEAERQARDQRKVDILLVVLTTIGAIAAGLAMNVMSGFDFFPGGLPG